jgi:hypothetical protein
MNIDRTNSQQNTGSSSETSHTKKIFHFRDPRMIQHMQIYKCNTQINRSKDKNHMIISNDTEKAFDKIQHPFIITALKKLGIEGIYTI